MPTAATTPDRAQSPVQPSGGVDLKRFNDEHTRLGELLQAANLAAHEHIEPQILREQLSSIFAYSLMHFSEEEQLMASVNYPGLSAHRAEHCEILSRLQMQLAHYDSDPRQVSIDILEMLEQWLDRHVRDVDSRYMRFLGEM